mmetsp:Transcript_13615/g.23720  ORF Transcript_13615/g.23720 Transcript_13615/m.23720 type:complete len:326 (+) Transcript_13615:2-979(+)
MFALTCKDANLQQIQCCSHGVPNTEATEILSVRSSLEPSEGYRFQDNTYVSPSVDVKHNVVVDDSDDLAWAQVCKVGINEARKRSVVDIDAMVQSMLSEIDDVVQCVDQLLPRLADVDASKKSGCLDQSVASISTPHFLVFQGDLPCEFPDDSLEGDHLEKSRTSSMATAEISTDLSSRSSTPSIDSFEWDEAEVTSVSSQEYGPLRKHEVPLKSKDGEPLGYNKALSRSRSSCPGSFTVSPIALDVLQDALSSCMCQISELEERKVVVLADCNSLLRELTYLAGDALDSACSGMVGAMDIFEKANKAIERIACMLGNSASSCTE